MGFVGDQVESIRSIQVRQALAQIISLGDARSTITSSPSPAFFPDVFGIPRSIFALRSVGSWSGVHCVISVVFP
jgi:hypothetical protein